MAAAAMALPGVRGNFSPAGQALGLGGSAADQTGESEEERKRRLAALQASQRGIGATLGGGYGASMSPAAMSLGLWGM